MLCKAANGAPIKINTSMSPMVSAPKHEDIAPLNPQQQQVTPSSTASSSSYSVSHSYQTPLSPISPISPPSSTKSIESALEQMHLQMEEPYSMENTMKKNGFVPIKNLGTTLQGSVWKVQSSNEKKKTFVIKATQKLLHSKSSARINGKNISVQEDIIKETAILRYLTSNEPPNTLAKFEGFFSDKQNYFLVMENGGDGFFEFVTKCHQFISKGKLSIAEWHRFCKLAFVQMVHLVHWLHVKMNCCHLDLSLENFVIDNCRVMVDEKTNQITFCNDFVIKLIDFGLSEVFIAKDNATAVNFRCRKFVGKTAYKAPRVYAKQRPFDARAADCWSLGVILFMMIVGGSPYQRPDKNDATFAYIMNDQILELLEQWNRSQFINATINNLLQRIFKREKNRINIDEISKHPWLL